MIKSFRHSDTEKVVDRMLSRRLPNDIQSAALRKLRMLNHAADLADLRSPPASRLEKLSGDRQGQHSIRINDQWRICFLWRGGDAHEVEMCDYLLRGETT